MKKIIGISAINEGISKKTGKPFKLQRVYLLEDFKDSSTGYGAIASEEVLFNDLATLKPDDIGKFIEFNFSKNNFGQFSISGFNLSK